jgi:hypothetical protein
LVVCSTLAAALAVEGVLSYCGDTLELNFRYTLGTR